MRGLTIPYLLRVVLTSVAAALFLAACGGGGEEAAAPTPTEAGTPSLSPTPAAVAPPAGCADAPVAPVLRPDAPCVTADMDGDGEPEFVEIATIDATPIPGVKPTANLGTIVIHDRAGAKYQRVFDLASMTGSMPVLSPKHEEGKEGIAYGGLLVLTLYAVDDFNDDGTFDLAATTYNCGAHTCSVTLYVMGYDGNKYRSILAPQEPGVAPLVSAPQAENQITFTDLDGDGPKELVFRTGTVRSAGAGPQRESTMTYRWDGTAYVLESVVNDPSNYRYLKVRDADAAFTAGDYAQAIALYQAAADPALEDYRGFGSKDELLAYSLYRMGLARAGTGDGPASAEALNAAAASYPNTLHATVAALFRDSVDLSGEPSRDGIADACRAVNAFVDENLKQFQDIWYHGYANPEFDPAAFCRSD